MALLKFENIGITALAAAVPKNTVDNYTFGTAMGVTNMDDVVAKIGVKERRRADEATCSSDLCFAAAERLIADNNIDRSEIDLLVFISQTPTTACPLPR